MPAITTRATQTPHREDRPAGARRRQRHTGQGIVEFALLTPVLLLLLLVAVDFGRAYSAYIQVTSAAREGAAFGSRSSENANNQSLVQDAALADSSSIYGKPLTVVSNTQMDSYSYEQVVVTVSYDFETLVDFPGIPSSIPMSRTVTMRVIGS